MLTPLTPGSQASILCSWATQLFKKLTVIPEFKVCRSLCRYMIMSKLYCFLRVNFFNSQGVSGNDSYMKLAISFLQFLQRGFIHLWCPSLTTHKYALWFTYEVHIELWWWIMKTVDSNIVWPSLTVVWSKLFTVLWLFVWSHLLLPHLTKKSETKSN